MVILGGILSQEPSALSPAGQYQVEKIIHFMPAEEERLEIVEKKSILVILLGLLGIGSVVSVEVKTLLFFYCIQLCECPASIVY